MMVSLPRRFVAIYTVLALEPVGTFLSRRVRPAVCGPDRSSKHSTLVPPISKNTDKSLLTSQCGASHKRALVDASLRQSKFYPIKSEVARMISTR